MTPRNLILGLAAALILAPSPSAGDGKYSTLLGAWDFGVSVRFDATVQQKDRMKTEFEKASLLIYDASDGQQEFGDVFCCNNKGGGKAAEYWVLAPGSAWCSRAPGRFGVSGQHVELCYDDMAYSNAKADGSWVVAHEWGHHAYGIKDEYSGPTAGAKECVVVPADVTQRTACLIENFWNHGADGASLTEWCVSSNHDPNHDTYQHSINGKSCWESLVAAYPDVTAPAGLPDAGPTTNEFALFTWTELDDGNRFVVVIDRSGSMGSQNKMELAKLGGKIFTNLTRDTHKLGVVQFSSSASAIYALNPMDAAARTAAKLAIDGLFASGGTNIDAGLSVALGMITGDGDRACQQAIVLLSDGDQGGPVGAALIDNLISNGVVVHSIALGSSGVDIPTMQAVASQTGGKFFAATLGAQLPGIFAQLAAETAEGGVLNTANGTLAPGASTVETFAVDSTTGQVSFVVSWDTDPGDLVVSVSSPSATFDENTVDPEVSFSTDGASVSVVISGSKVEAGDWDVALGPPLAPPGAGSSIAYEVQAISDSKELTFEASADAQAYTYPDGMLLTASATFDKAITNIDVMGVVRRPDGSEAEVVLKDDGSSLSGDAEAGDGVYSGRFDTWGSDGSYTVAIDAINDGSGKLTGGEGLKPPGETTVSGGQPDPFERHTEFSVTLVGAPFLQRFGLAADKFKVAISSKSDDKNKLALAAHMNLPEDAVDPAADTLMLELGDLFESMFAPEDLKQVGKKPRYAFKDASISGYVDLFGKGTSQGSYKVSLKGFPSGFVFGGFGDLESVPIGLAWGDMDYTATIAANVAKSGMASSFTGKKDVYDSEELYVSSVKVGLNAKKQESDKLSLRAKAAGGQFGAFDPANNTTTISFGPWILELAPGDWSADKKGTKLSYRSPDKSISITFGTETQELSINAKNQSLGSVTPTVQFAITSGAYVHRREIKMATNNNGTAFSY